MTCLYLTSTVRISPVPHVSAMVDRPFTTPRQDEVHKYETRMGRNNKGKNKDESALCQSLVKPNHPLDRHTS